MRFWFFLTHYHNHKKRPFLFCLRNCFLFFQVFFHTVDKKKRYRNRSENFFLGCAVSALVWKLALYPPKVARKSFLNAPRLPWSGKSDQDLESPECRAASNLIWNIAPPLPCPENCAAINKGAKSAQQNFLSRCFKLLSHFLSVQLMLKSRQLRNFQGWWCYSCRTLWFFFNCLVECCSDKILKILKYLELMDHQNDNPELLCFGYNAEPTARKSVFPRALIPHKLFPVYQKQQLVLITILKPFLS